MPPFILLYTMNIDLPYITVLYMVVISIPVTKHMDTLNVKTKLYP